MPRGARRRAQRLNEGHERGAEEQGVDDEEGGLDGGGREHFAGSEREAYCYGGILYSSALIEYAAL